MPLQMIYEKGDTIYYPKISVKSDRPMTVKDLYVGNGKRGLFAQYLTDDLLDNLAMEMHDNIEQHFDNVIVVTGDEGAGKSNLAYALAKKFDPEFNINDGYVYDLLPFLQKLQAGNLKGKVLWLDEGTNLLSARNWMTDVNKSVDQILEMFRSYKMTLIICIPKLYRLDEYVRESRMRYHLTAAKRYWQHDTESKRGYFEAKRWPNFKTICWGTFPEIPPEEKEIYEKIKAGSQSAKAAEILQKFENAQTPRLQKSTEYNRKLAMMLVDSGCSYREISEETGIPEGTLRRWIHEGD